MHREYVTFCFVGLLELGQRDDANTTWKRDMFLLVRDSMDINSKFRNIFKSYSIDIARILKTF